MKTAFVIVGLVILNGSVMFIKKVKQTHSSKKLKTVHRSDYDGTPLFV